MRRNGRVVALVALIVALAAVLVYQFGNTGATSGTAPSGTGAPPPRAAAGRRSQGPASSAVPTVRLDALQAARSLPPPAAAERNPFQFQPKVAPLPPPMPVPRPGTPGSGVDAAGNPIPPPPPPPPPIPFKFIGIVQASNQKLAVLADNSTKDVFYGREGDVVDGRYRILRIGVESVEMAYLDGRGRQTIRLSGS